MMRFIVAIVAGLIVTTIVIVMVEAIGHAAFPIRPVPPGSGTVATIPLPLHLVVIGGYLAGTLLGGWIAVTIARREAASWIIGAIFATAGIANALTVPQPVWAQAAAVLAPLLGAALALHMLRRT